MTQPQLEDVAPFGVSRESYERLLILKGLTETWQKHINLVAPSTVDDLWRRHIIDSTQLLPLLPKGAQAIADLGSGGGFPSLVLAATQSATVHMFEANGKKVSFLLEALRQMKASGQVHRIRLEPLRSPPNMPKVDVVTARAFAPLSLLLSLAEPFMRGGAVGLFHKGQDYHAELTEAAKTWKISVREIPSVTDSQSVILEIKELSHV